MEEEFIFGKYRILRLLANGSGGEIFLAEHKTLGVRRIIKRLYKHMPFYEERCREANILKQLHHAAIPRLYDMEEDESASYIIEEAVEGETLNEILFRQKNLPVSFILFYSIQLCEVFEYLHKEGILYLDVKPDNLMIAEDKLYLIDFGSATVKTEKSAVTFGTGWYAAPEQYNGDMEERTDVFGIGRVIGLMLGHVEATKSKQEKELQSIYLRCIQPIPAKRYRNVSELKDCLCRLYGSRGGPASEHPRQKGTERNGAYGVMGVGEGTEAAAFCVTLAGYFGEREKGRVACIDLSEGEVFQALYRSLHGNHTAVPKQFRIRDVTYRIDGDWNSIAELSSEGYTTLVVYCGQSEELFCEAFYRLDRGFLIGSCYPWDLCRWEQVSQKLKNAAFAKRTVAIVTGGDKEELPSRFLHVKEGPRVQDVYHADRKTEQFLRELL